MTESLNKFMDLGRAMGYVRTIVRDIEKCNSTKTSKLDLTTERRRKRSCMTILKSYDGVRIDAISERGYKSISVLYLSSVQLPDGQGLIAASIERSLFDAPRNEGLLLDTMEPENGTLTTISMHSVQRAVQRAGVRSTQDLINVMGAASNWTAIANLKDHSGPFMIPTRKGLICCDTVINLKNSSAKGSLVKTFLGFDEMNISKRNFWDKLVSKGVLEYHPRAVKKFIKIEDYEESFDLMAEEGEKWRLNSERRNVEPEQDISHELSM